MADLPRYARYDARRPPQGQILVPEFHQYDSNIVSCNRTEIVHFHGASTEQINVCCVCSVSTSTRRSLLETL
jgi:hypothetical protein